LSGSKIQYIYRRQKFFKKCGGEQQPVPGDDAVQSAPGCDVTGLSHPCAGDTQGLVSLVPLKKSFKLK
jgi:hypothetical protein